MGIINDSIVRRFLNVVSDWNEEGHQPDLADVEWELRNLLEEYVDPIVTENQTMKAKWIALGRLNEVMHDEEKMNEIFKEMAKLINTSKVRD